MTIAVLNTFSAAEGFVNAKWSGLTGFLLAKACGVPTTDPIPTRISTHIGRENDALYWDRHFGRRFLRTEVRFDNGRLVETLGPIQTHFDVSAADSVTKLVSVESRVFGVKIPSRLTTVEVAATQMGNGRFRTKVEIEIFGGHLGRLTYIANMTRVAATAPNRIGVNP